MTTVLKWPLIWSIGFVLLFDVLVADLVDNENPDGPPRVPVREEPDDRDQIVVKTFLQRTRGLPSAMTLMQFQHGSTGFMEIDSSDLHTAYRLPLQRLSDSQLQLLLKKFEKEGEEAPKLTRTEMIEKLKEKIGQKDKILRPRLLTNVNVLSPAAEMTLPNEPVVDLDELERTTLGPIISATPALAETPISTPILVDNENGQEAMARSHPEELTVVTKGPIRRAHKRLPADATTLPPPEDPIAEEMRKKNNRLHAAYVASLSEDLQRLKTRYETTRLEFLRTLRRINERNVHRRSRMQFLKTYAVNAVPTFVVPQKEVDLHSGAIGEKAASFEEKPADIQTTSAPAPLGGERIEDEIIANRQLLTSTVTPAPAEEVTPASISDENAETSEQPADVSAFFNSGTSADSSTTAGEPEKQTETPTEPTTISTVKLDGREIIDSESEGEIKVQVAPARIVTTDFEAIKTASSNSETAEHHESIVNVHEQQDAAANFNHIPHPLSIVDAMTEIEREVMDPTVWKLQANETGMDAKLKMMLKKVDENTNTQDLIERLQEEAVQLTIDSQTATDAPLPKAEPLDVLVPKTAAIPCDPVSCNFEDGKFCRWKSSIDELSPANRRSLHSNDRRRRQAADGYALRSWHVWTGKFEAGNLGMSRSDFFTGNNTRFASSYLKPHQRSTLSVELPKSANETTVRFRVWESVRNMQLKFCCNHSKFCVFQTDLGVLRGTRKWLQRTAVCPAGTRRIIWECVNHGKFQGACGLDEIQLLNTQCTPTPAVPQAVSYLVDSDR